MSESLADALARLERFLAEVGRPAALIGGVAVIARAATRPTEDIDLVAKIDTGGLDALLALAKNHGYAFDEGTRELAELGLVRLFPSGSKKDGFGVDILFADNPYYEEILARATPVAIAGVSLRVATAEDLVLLKLEANRPGDIEDVLTIKDGLGASLDLGYLRLQADRLGLRQKLDLYFPP